MLLLDILELAKQPIVLAIGEFWLVEHVIFVLGTREFFTKRRCSFDQRRNGVGHSAAVAVRERRRLCTTYGDIDVLAASCIRAFEVA